MRASIEVDAECLVEVTPAPGGAISRSIWSSLMPDPDTARACAPSAMANPSIGKIGQKKPAPATAQITMSTAVTTANVVACE
jgi:hypothetical protein